MSCFCTSVLDSPLVTWAAVAVGGGRRWAMAGLQGSDISLAVAVLIGMESESLWGVLGPRNLLLPLRSLGSSIPCILFSPCCTKGDRLGVGVLQRTQYQREKPQNSHNITLQGQSLTHFTVRISSSIKLVAKVCCSGNRTNMHFLCLSPSSL